LHLFPHWNWSKGDTVDLWAYYNRADSVELFLNGRSLGVSTKTPDRLHAFWRVVYEPGTVMAVSYSEGKEFMRRSVTTAGEPASLLLTADRNVLDADGYDLAFITVTVMDAEGNLVPYAAETIRFEVEGPAVIEAVDNGSPISHEPFKATERKAFHGKCLVILRAGTEPGKVTLKATSESFAQEFALDLETRLVE
ncbi:MAG TPA: DUF4982 domain-containing protein, partial [Bacteroidales bacterium]|nr:DUF4982 domain-containing protein [Bacteroidales bacterium]